MQAAYNQKVVLSMGIQVVKAELIRCLDIINSNGNGTFSATHNDNEKHKIVFLNSAHFQKPSKVKYKK